MAIVKSLSGFVNVYSKRDKGTTFKAYLPAAEGSSEAHSHHSRKASLPRGNGGLVLVVDEEPSILPVSHQILKAFGYRVLAATDRAGGIAGDIQHNNEITVVLTDRMKPAVLL